MIKTSFSNFSPGFILCLYPGDILYTTCNLLDLLTLCPGSVFVAGAAAAALEKAGYVSSIAAGAASVPYTGSGVTLW